MGRVVGIDLGTTNSVVAITEAGKPLVIPNSEGSRTTPSVVGFNKDGELVVGQIARRQAVLNPQNTFYGIKRFMGRSFAEMPPELIRLPYTVRPDENDNIKIRCPRLQKEFAPEEISAMILRKLAEEASRYLGEEVTGAVITVPAYFNDAQRQATRDAGRIAGLEVMRIINEPTAAALAYGLDKTGDRTILVFDLGGGTFDVSILDVGQGMFEVRATSGDTQLGGNDFDQRIVDWLADQFKAAEGVDLREDRQALQRLTEAAEKAKIELSGVAVTEINLPFITATEEGPKHIETRLTRAEFEELCGDLVSRLRRPLKRALSDAGLSPMQIDEVVLVGGSTRIPMVQELVRRYIDIEPNQNVNPDEVVAVGAAVQASILSGEVKDILLLDVTPLSVGLETIGGVMKTLIPRNTTIPVRKSDVFSTSENNQSMVEIHVLQGERDMAAGNKSLGRFKLMGIPPAPRGIPQIQVSFDIDANGILQVTARDKTTGREQGITVQGASTLSEGEVNRMIEDANRYAQEDRERRERIEKRNSAKALTDQAQRRLKEVTLDFGSQFAAAYRRRVDSLCQEINESLANDDERRLDRAEADLQDTLYELNREIRLQYEQEEDEGLFGAIKRTLIGDDEDEYPYDYQRGRDDDYWSGGRRPGIEDNSILEGGGQYRRDSYGYPRDDYRRDDYGAGTGYPRDEYRRDDYGAETGYPRDEYRRDDYGAGTGGYRDEYRRDDYGAGAGGYRDDYYSRRNSSERGDYPDQRSRPSNSPYRDDWDEPTSTRPPRRNGRSPRPEDQPRGGYYSRGRGRDIPYENNWDEEDDDW